jgi:acyl carrier protein
MSDMAKYRECFSKSFLISDEGGGRLETLEYQGVKEWDSVGHMALIANIEDAFGIMLDMEDVIGFSSFEVGVGILAKYDIKVS